MEKTKNSQVFSYVGAGLMLLALLFPFLRISVFGMSHGMGLLFDMGHLGDINGLMYFIAFLGIAVLGYVAYITLKVKDDYMKAAYAGAAFFIVLFIMFFIVKGDIGGEIDSEFRGFAAGFIKMGFGIFMPLLSGAAFFMADKAFVKEKTEQQENIQ